MAQRNEGEGRRAAARAESRRTRHFVKTGRARKTSKRTAAIDTPAGAAMSEAEIKGKEGARGEDPNLQQKGAPGRDPKPDSDLD